MYLSDCFQGKPMQINRRTLPVACCVLVAACSVLLSGCSTPPPTHEQLLGPAYDRPFPLGQVSDAFWESQQTNAEASDFIFYDHEFEGESENLTPGGRDHLLQVGLRLKQVPFPIVIEQSVGNQKPELDRQRRQRIVDRLMQMGVNGVTDQRVIIAPALAAGITAMEGEAAYYRTLGYDDFGDGGGTGRRFHGRGGTFR